MNSPPDESGLSSPSSCAPSLMIPRFHLSVDRISKIGKNLKPQRTVPRGSEECEQGMRKPGASQGLGFRGARPRGAGRRAPNESPGAYGCGSGPKAGWHGVMIPRFRRHPGWRENAPGVVDGTKETKVVHARVQGRSGAAGPGRRPQRPRGGEGAGPDGDGAAGVGEERGGGRGEGPARSGDDGGARGARAAAARQQAAGDGARDLEKSGGLLREGESVRFALIDAEKAHYPVDVLCAVLEVSRSG